jgi:hypothetical protein
MQDARHARARPRATARRADTGLTSSSARDAQKFYACITLHNHVCDAGLLLSSARSEIAALRRINMTQIRSYGGDRLIPPRGFWCETSDIAQDYSATLTGSTHLDTLPLVLVVLVQPSPPLESRTSNTGLQIWILAPTSPECTAVTGSLHSTEQRSYSA